MTGQNRTFLTALANATPDTNFSHLRSFVLLSTQRTGSTLVCKDLESTGGFGKPGEHLLWLTKMYNQRKTVPSMDEFLSRGREKSDTLFSINIMANQLIYLGAWLATPDEALSLLNTPNGSRKLATSALTRFLPLFGSTYLVSLKRNDIFATTFSRLKARSTQKYHSSAFTKGKGQEKSTSLNFTTFEILQEMTSVERSYMMIKEALDQTCERHLDVSYENASQSFPGYLEPILAFCGLEPELSLRAKRSLKKVVSGTELKEQKDRFMERIGFLLE